MRIIMFALVILAVPVLAHAATLKVPGQYATIQQAIDTAVNGDTVLVAPGTYTMKPQFLRKVKRNSSSDFYQSTYASL
jgi:hypothetical protein